MRILFAVPLLVALVAPAAAQRQNRPDPAPEAQERQANGCNVRQDAWGAIAPAQNQNERTRRDQAACSKRHLIQWTPSRAAPAQRAR